MTRFTQTFGLCGVAFGVLVALGNSVPGHFAWYDFALTFLLSAAAFSAALSVVGWAFTRLVPATWLSRIVLFAVLEVVAVAVALAIVFAMWRIPHGRFDPLPGPPESPVAFDGVRGLYPRSVSELPRHNVVVRTVEGHRFELRTDSAQRFAWRRLADQRRSLDSIGDGVGRDSTLYYRVPAKYGQAIASLVVKDHATECSWEAHYLLMADHSLWFWDDGGCGMFYGLVLPVLAALLALLLAIVGFTIAHRDWDRVTIS